ncbi:hypothetical protein N9A94_09625 [Akkermansiaceae bacterium]|nr:hypothetical protein [Akkermansiaceae bacterium]
MISKLQRLLLLVKDRRAHPGLRGIMDEMRTNDALSPCELEEVKRGLLKDSLTRAMECPYYSRAFRTHRVDAQSPDSLQNFPPLQRSTTQEHREEFLHPEVDPSRLLKKTTSGSTGTKASFYRSRSGLDWGYATGERSKEYWGLDRTARYGRVWGRSFKFKSRVRDRLRGYAALAKDRSIGVYNIDASALSVEYLEELWDQLVRWKPARLHGYAAGIYLIAKFVNEAGLPGRNLKLDSAILESEQCFDFQKEEIRRAFGCPVLEWYGCVEVGVIATPCRNGRLHIREDHVHLEVVDGKILLTTLREPAMPLIRYEVGDEAEISEKPCSCGLPSRTFAELRGRSPDQLRRLDGSFFPGHMLTHAFDQFPRIRRFQLIQKTEDLVKVLVEVNETLTGQERSRLIESLQKLFGGAIVVDLEECTEIPTQESGKFRWVISELSGGGL